MAHPGVLWDFMRTIPLYKDLFRLSVRDGSAIMGSEVAGKHLDTIFAAVIVIS